jgi:hypothetical protein
MNKISIIVPSIRTALWDSFYQTIATSCKKYLYEVIFIGPFANEEFLKQNPTVKFIKSYSNPTTCFQLAVLESSGDFLYFVSDDSLLYPNSLDVCCSYLINNNPKSNILNCRYREGNPIGLYEFPLAYWIAGSYPQYRLKYINPNWGMAIQTLISKKLFIEMGGFDCAFQFSNHAHTDLSFRIQNCGGFVLQSPCEISNVQHLSDKKGDHRTVEEVQTNEDSQLFSWIWNNEPNRKYLDYNNYTKHNRPWEKRFKRLYNSYEEMCDGENYENIIPNK